MRSLSRIFMDKNRQHSRESRRKGLNLFLCIPVCTGMTGMGQTCRRLGELPGWHQQTRRFGMYLIQSCCYSVLLLQFFLATIFAFVFTPFFRHLLKDITRFIP